MRRPTAPRALWLAAALAAGCARTPAPRPVAAGVALPATGPASLLVTGVRDSAALRAQARALGLRAEGDAVVAVSGDSARLRALTVAGTETGVRARADEAIDARSDGAIAPDEQVFYLARKEFGLPAYLESHPSHDGRGVIVGLIDDGISPQQAGFRETTTGARKILARAGRSSRLKLTATRVERGAPDLTAFAASYTGDYAAAWQATLDERGPIVDTEIDGGFVDQFDLNGDGVETTISVAAFQRDDSVRICVDADRSGAVGDGECFGGFAATGEFGYWDAARFHAILGELDPATGVITLSQGEAAGDSHGEGVASVLAGHGIGGRYDGLAPGAQILDYDLSERTATPSEEVYTIGTFLTALDWLGAHGAQVVNVSYSLYFHSASAQRTMREALDDLVERYHFVISWSGGNNGPGLASLNRRQIYPETSLVAGAYVSRDLDQYVHGVTGLPPEGRVVWYSSRGPGPDGARGPLVISPLASLTHSDPEEGFWAFSGTSSASPALAGFATVVISALKDEGLALDPLTLVDAIRLGAEPLPGVPYVVQGAGLPQITRVLDAYRRLARGDDFAHVATRTDGVVGPDGIDQAGALLKTSNLSVSTELAVSLRGVVSPLVPEAQAAALLKPIRLEYSDSWLAGPARLWVARADSNFALSITDPRVASATPAAREWFGEVRILDDDTGARIATVPVTVVRDDALVRPIHADGLVVQPEDGIRLHVDVPAGTKGLRVKASVEAGPRPLELRVYDPAGTIIGSTVLEPATPDLILPVATPGWHQVTIYRYGGSATPARADLVVEPIAVDVPTGTVTESDAYLQVRNAGTSAQEARIALFVKPTVVAAPIVTVRGGEALRTTVDVDPAGGLYRVDPRPLDRSELVNPLDTCVFTLRSDASVGIYSSFDGNQLDIPAAPGVARTLEIYCQPFEGLIPYLPATSWRLEVSRTASEHETAVADATVRLAPGRNEVPLRWSADAQVAPGTELDVVLLSPFADRDTNADAAITIGAVTRL
jgi:hypothetical protein